MSETGVSFLRKTRDEIQNVPIVDGQLIFETDQENNSKIYTDIGTDRITIGGKTDVVDELNSTSVIDALSANKGRELNTSIENIIDGTAVVANTIQPYTHSGNTLTGSGVNGQFKATSSMTLRLVQVGTEGNYTTCTIVNGDDTELEIVEGRWYQFIKDGTVLNFSKASGLKLKVVGGETQPTTPSNGTIWVKTDTDIAYYQLRADKPTTRSDGSALQDGDVWVSTTSSCGQEIYVDSKNEIVLRIGSAFVLNDTEWDAVNTNVFSTSWMNVSKEFKESEFDGEFSVTAGVYGVATTNQYRATVSEVDVSNYNVLEVGYSEFYRYPEGGTIGTLSCGVSTTQTGTSFNASSSVGSGTPSNKLAGTIYVDVSDLTGALYIKIRVENRGTSSNASHTTYVTIDSVKLYA